MLIDYVSLIGGFAILIVAGDLLVRGAVGIAERLGIPSLVIGLTIVAFGTSAPEMVISVKAALNGAPGIAVGNVIGSNICNVLAVLGMPALVAAISCREEGATRNSLIMVAISVIFIAMLSLGVISRIGGVFLLALLALFLWDMVRTTQRHRRKNACAGTTGDLGAALVDEAEDDGDVVEALEKVEGVPDRPIVAAVYIALGLIGLPLGAHFAIDGATSLARTWGVTETVIGLTVVALGTSLPELATTLMAAVRQQSAVALGNIVGSNIFNILAILGVTAVVTPIAIPPEVMRFDVWVMFACALLVLAFARYQVSLFRLSGLALTALYGLYVYVTFALGNLG